MIQSAIAQTSWLPSFFTERSPAEIVIILSATAIVVGLVIFGSFVLDQRILLGAALALGILQGFEPVGYMSVALLVFAALGPGSFHRADRNIRRESWFIAVVCLAVWQGVSLLWAAEIGAVAHAVLSSIALASMYILARQVASNAEGFDLALVIAAPFVLLQAWSTIVFRLSPSIEDAYLRSPVARFLSEPEVAELFDGVAQNASDPDKAGGFLLNGNIASLLLGLCFCLYLRQAMITRRTLHAIVALSALGGVFLTGSKSPLVALTLLAVLIGLILVLSRRSRAAIAVATITAAAAVAAAGAAVLLRPALLGQTVVALGDRGRLWSLAAEAFPSHWALGVGYGGWAELINARFSEVFGSDRPYQMLPPHNFFIQAWADSGLVELALVLFLSIAPIAIAARSLARTAGTRLGDGRTLVSALTLAGVAWPVLHGLMDTTRFFGENHILAFFACLVAATFATATKERPRKEADEHDR